MKWSPEQWQAIALSHKNLLVSAAAGSTSAMAASWS